jgi:hypothetical protein
MDSAAHGKPPLVDVFYNDGVNWPATGDSPAHACFAGYTGFLG